MKNFLKDIFFVIIGCFLYTVYISVLLIPNELGTGGVAGIAMCLNSIFGINIGILMLVINIPLFIFGFKLIGKKFAIMSGLVIISSSFLIDFMNGNFIFVPLEEKLLATIFTGVVSGIAMSLLFISGASTGGTDISAKILKSKFRTLDLTKLLLFQDILIYTLVGIVLGLNSVMYAVIMSFIRAKTIDAIQEGLASSRQCIIISELSQDIVHQVQIKLGRGVTLLNAEGGYSRTNKKFIYVVVQKNQLIPLKKIVDSIDPHAFITVTAVSNVLGNYKQKSLSVQ